MVVKLKQAKQEEISDLLSKLRGNEVDTPIAKKLDEIIKNFDKNRFFDEKLDGMEIVGFPKVFVIKLDEMVVKGNYIPGTGRWHYGYNISFSKGLTKELFEFYKNRHPEDFNKERHPLGKWYEIDVVRDFVKLNMEILNKEDLDKLGEGLKKYLSVIGALRPRMDFLGVHTIDVDVDKVLKDFKREIELPALFVKEAGKSGFNGAVSKITNEVCSRQDLIKSLNHVGLTKMAEKVDAYTYRAGVHIKDRHRSSLDVINEFINGEFGTEAPNAARLGDYPLAELKGRLLSRADSRGVAESDLREAIRDEIGRFNGAKEAVEICNKKLLYRRDETLAKQYLEESLKLIKENEKTVGNCKLALAILGTSQNTA